MEKEFEKRKGIPTILKGMEPGDVEHFAPSQYGAVASTVSRLNSHYRTGYRWKTQFLAGDKTVKAIRVS